MARRYSVSGSQTTGGASKTVLGLTSAATIRPRLFEIVIGSNSTPADNSAEWVIQRATAAGTSTAFTPIALDPADPAALASAGFNHTVEPTYTASAVLLDFALNQRATFRWIAAPFCELVLPATAANGVGLKPTAQATTFLGTATFIYEE